MKEPSIEYLALLGYLYLRNGKIAEATTVLEGLAVLDPGNSWVRRTLAYVYLNGGEYQKCLAQIDQTTHGKRSSTEKLIQVRALFGLGRRDEARRLIKQMQGKLRDTDGK